jgi:hypothetical protein
MLDFIVPFLVYALAFAAGSFIAFAAASRLHPATSEEEALAELEAQSPTGGVR